MTKENDFEYREKLFMIVFFGIFGLSVLWCNEENQQFFTSKFFYKCYISDWVHDGGIQTCCGWGRQVWIWGEIKNNYHFLEISDCKDTDTRNTNRQFSHQKPFYKFIRDKTSSFGLKMSLNNEKN